MEPVLVYFFRIRFPVDWGAEITSAIWSGKNHKMLIETMKEADIPGEEIQLISNIYKNQTAQVKTKNKISSEIKIYKGVR